MAIDYDGLIATVAKHFWGDPNEQLSKPSKELRFGQHGSKSVDLEKGTFYDHEAVAGGGVLDLVCTEAGFQSRAEAHQWLVEQGFIANDQAHLQQTPKPVARPELTKTTPEPPKTVVSKAKPRITDTYDYCDENGQLLMQVVRLEPKTFRQRKPVGNGWSWSVKDVRQVPFRLPQLLASTAMVFIVEGEKDALNLEAIGLVATCNAGGAGKWRKVHAALLKGRDVVILPDNDQAGRDHAAKILETLQGVAASVKVVELPDLPEKGDVSDWLAAGGTADQLLALVGTATAAEAAQSDSDKERESQADQLLKVALAHYELLRDDQKIGYAKHKDSGVVFRLNSVAFKDSIYAAWVESRGKTVRSASYAECLENLQALSRKGDAQNIFLRAAHHSSGYFIDLCQPNNSQAVHLSAKGWYVVDKPPVVFVRGEAMQALPYPVGGGSLGMLWEVLNVPEDARLLVVAFIIDAMRPNTPYAGLELLGEQGSGKSVSAKFIRRLIDPNACDLRGAPKTVEDIFVVAAHSHVVTFENISHLHGSMQDALCILSTGGGIAKRTLYSNDEESIISVQRPWIVNGISAAITQQDLVDRTISIDCPVIEERGTSVDLHDTFEANQAALLGALFDVASKALALLPSVRLAPKDRPRLAEFAMLGMAVAQAMGHDPMDFMRQFTAARRESIARVLDASPVATAVVDWIEASPHGMTAPVKDILHRLEQFKPHGSDSWPRSAKGLGDALRRAAPALRQMGIQCKCLGKVGGTVKWEVKKNLPIQSPASPEVLTNDADEQDIRTCRTSSTEVFLPKEVL